MHESREDCKDTALSWDMSDPYADGNGLKILPMFDPYADGNQKIWPHVRSEEGPKVAGRPRGLIQIRTFVDPILNPRSPSGKFKGPGTRAAPARSLLSLSALEELSTCHPLPSRKIVVPPRANCERYKDSEPKFKIK
ncbi:hypothetical protein BDZ97DRAFT_1760941 [Flammula alnicola]|nr:hypothetical protein BDZ97DRAFT_1760941 [Flammula alnicola]